MSSISTKVYLIVSVKWTNTSHWCQRTLICLYVSTRQCHLNIKVIRTNKIYHILIMLIFLTFKKNLRMIIFIIEIHFSKDPLNLTTKGFVSVKLSNWDILAFMYCIHFLLPTIYMPAYVWSAKILNAPDKDRPLDLKMYC